jgi:hypothetical protein
MVASRRKISMKHEFRMAAHGLCKQMQDMRRQ